MTQYEKLEHGLHPYLETQVWPSDLKIFTEWSRQLEPSPIKEKAEIFKAAPRVMNLNLQKAEDREKLSELVGTYTEETYVEPRQVEGTV